MTPYGITRPQWVNRQEPNHRGNSYATIPYVFNGLIYLTFTVEYNSRLHIFKGDGLNNAL